ncbi:MAG: ADP-ribosylglycohydrolase family protein [Bacteroidota bacterium]
MPASPDDRARGALLGTAIGDALGMPIEGLSHPNVRTYYKGIKGFRADEKRGELDAGQWTADTQNALALATALAEHPDDRTRAQAVWRQERLVDLRRPTERPVATSAAAASAAPLGIWWHTTEADATEALAWARVLLGDVDPRADALVAAIAQADALRRALGADPETLDGPAFVRATAEAARTAETALDDATDAVSTRLGALADHLDEFPLDLQDRCNGTGPAADEAFPFALAMAARGPSLAEASLLAAINVGGDANTVGAMVGALLGAMNGASAFPDEWRKGVQDGERITALADRMRA